MTAKARRIRVDLEDVQLLVEVIDDAQPGMGTGHGVKLEDHELQALDRLRTAILYGLQARRSR